MSSIVLATLVAVVFVSAFVQGALGIGFALIVAPVAGVLQPGLLPVTLLILMLPLNFLVAWRERAAIDWAGARWITAGRFVGTFAGLWLLTALSAHQLDQAVGWFTVIAAAAALLAPPFAATPSASQGVGLCTGITETATGIGGPPLALLYQHANGPTLRATVAVCFLVGEIMSLVILAISGKIDSSQVISALYLAPAALAGSALSKLTHSKIDGNALRLSVLIFALLSGAYLIVK